MNGLSLRLKVSLSVRIGKGKLFKGTPFDYKKYNFYEKQRISELQAQLEENSQIILY